MVGQLFMEVVSQEPPQAEAVGGDLHELAFGADALKEHNELEFEKDDRVNRRAPTGGVAWVDELADKGEVQRALDVAIELVGWHEIVERDVDKWGERAALGSQHMSLAPSAGCPSLSWGVRPGAWPTRAVQCARESGARAGD